jgi:adenylate cyclase
VIYQDKIWEIDEFQADNRGLIVAEVELSSVDEKIDKPSWLGKEVSNDARYYNVCLVQHPYSAWDD